MAKTFGRLLRGEREGKEVSMGALARHLRVSVPYLSDVERDRRSPLSADRIDAAAKFLRIDPEPLLAAAAESRGGFELPVNGTTTRKAREVGAGLQRGWQDLDDAYLRRIEQILEEAKKHRR